MAISGQIRCIWVLLVLGSICLSTVCIQDTTPPDPGCPTQNDAAADNDTNTAVYVWNTTATDDQTDSDDIFVSCLPPSGSRFKFGKTNRVVCTAVDAAGNVGTCTFDVRVTGENCEPPCSVETSCKLLPDGESLCLCSEGYEYGVSPCTARNECSSPYGKCDAEANCTELDPPEHYSCECKEGFYGDGFHYCERSDVLVKRFYVVLAVLGSSANGCDPDVTKTSNECSSLVKAFEEFASELYRLISPDNFIAVTVQQDALSKAQSRDPTDRPIIIIPHTVTYDYAGANQDIRRLQLDDFFERSVLEFFG